jgi:hypothetical protein
MVQNKSESTKNVQQVVGCMQNSVNHRKPYQGHTSNQSGTHKKPDRVTRVYAKLGEVCELDLGHASNQIGQQISRKSVWEILRNLFRKMIRTKFREINFNCVFREIKKIAFRIHPS